MHWNLSVLAGSIIHLAFEISQAIEWVNLLQGIINWQSRRFLIDTWEREACISVDKGFGYDQCFYFYFLNSKWKMLRHLKYISGHHLEGRTREFSLETNSVIRKFSKGPNVRSFFRTGPMGLAHANGLGCKSTVHLFWMVKTMHIMSQPGSP